MANTEVYTDSYALELRAYKAVELDPTQLGALFDDITDHMQHPASSRAFNDSVRIYLRVFFELFMRDPGVANRRHLDTRLALGDNMPQGLKDLSGPLTKVSQPSFGVEEAYRA